MKNLLMSICTILLIVFIVIAASKGITIGKYEVLSIKQIMDKSNELNGKIDELNTLNNITYKKAYNDLTDATKKLTTTKASYLDIASVSSDSEIKEANQEQIYSMEYLWSRIGNHATKEGVNIKLEVNSTGSQNKNTLNFTVVGSYMGIRNFVYSLENDSDLNFRIENFKISSGQNEENLNGTFKVNNVEIKQENVSTSVTQSSSTVQNSTTENTVQNTTDNTTTGNTSTATNVAQ